MGHCLAVKRQMLERAVTGLSALNPLSVLGRGYALVQSEDGAVIPSAGLLETGQTVSLRFADGTAHAVICDAALSNQEQEVIPHE